jgi:hypothetical protein
MPKTLLAHPADIVGYSQAYVSDLLQAYVPRVPGSQAKAKNRAGTGFGSRTECPNLRAIVGGAGAARQISPLDNLWFRMHHGAP